MLSKNSSYSWLILACAPQIIVFGYCNIQKRTPQKIAGLEDVAMWLVVSVLVSKLEKHRHRATLTRDDEIDTTYLDNAMLDMQSGLLLAILALNLYFWVFTHVHLRIEMIAQTKKHSHRVPLL